MPDLAKIIIPFIFTTIHTISLITNLQAQDHSNLITIYGQVYSARLQGEIAPIVKATVFLDEVIPSFIETEEEIGGIQFTLMDEPNALTANDFTS